MCNDKCSGLESEHIFKIIRAWLWINGSKFRSIWQFSTNKTKDSEAFECLGKGSGNIFANLVLMTTLQHAQTPQRRFTNLAPVTPSRKFPSPSLVWFANTTSDECRTSCLCIVLKARWGGWAANPKVLKTLATLLLFICKSFVSIFCHYFQEAICSAKLIKC